MKLEWRISTAWRSGRSWSIARRDRPLRRASRRRARVSACAVVRGSLPKKLSKRARS